jgi:hypothetical protein
MSNIYVNSGIGAQLVMIPETTYGQAPAFTGPTQMPFEFDSEGLELKKVVAQGKGLHAGGVYNRAARRKLTNYEAAGPLNMDLGTRYLNQLIMQMLGSKGQANATLTQMGTTGVYKSVHAPGSLTGTSMCIQKGVPSVDGSSPNPFTYVGMKLSDWQISVATGGIAKLSTAWTGRNELGGPGNGDPLNVSVPALASFAEVNTADVFFFREAAVILGGTPSTTSGVTTITGGTTAGNIRSASVKQTFKYDTNRYFLGGNGFKGEPIENDYRTIGGSFEIEWLNAETMYAAFAQDTPTSLQLTFTGGVIGTSGTNTQLFSVLVPVMYLDTEAPKINGPAVVVQKCAWTGLDDGTNNPIQVTYQTTDTV